MRALTWTIVLALLATAAMGHRVNLFATVEGSEVVAEASYSKSKPVLGGRIRVEDGATGELLLEGATDDAGVFRFPVPEAARLHGLTLVLQAGEGHQTTWRMEPAEFGAPALPTASSAPSRETQDPAPASAPLPAAAPTADAAHIAALVREAVRSELEAALDTRLDTRLDARLEAKLAPLRRALLEDSGPRLRDILGGIGWIFGLVGIAAYCVSRRHVR